MDARQVRYFLAVVDHGGVTRAADALHIAQPSISQSVRALERELGVELFHRVGRGMELSTAGRAFLDPAREIVADLDAAMGAVRRRHSLDDGELDLAVTEELATDPLVDLIAAFRAAHPHVRVTVQRATEVEGAARLVREAVCELALCSLPDTDLGVPALPLATRSVVLVVPPGAPDVGPDPVPMSVVATLPLVFGPVGDATRSMVEARFRAAGLQPDVAVETNVATAVQRLVRQRAGAAFLPVSAAIELAPDGVTMHALDPPLTQSIGFLHRADSLSSASSAFLESALASES